jgi:hypothetical protein
MITRASWLTVFYELGMCDRYGEEIARMKQAEVALKQALTEVKRTSGDAVLQDIKVGPNISLTVQSQSILTPSYA